MPDVLSLLPGVCMALFFGVGGWFHLRRRHHEHIDRLVAMHKRQIGASADRLADVQRRADVLKHEVLLLKKEIVRQQVRASRDDRPGSRAVDAARVQRVERVPSREQRPEDGSGFADTLPWGHDLP